MSVIVYRILNRLKALLFRPNPREIDHLNFAVTYSCNSECIMCNIWQIYKKEPNKLNKELALDEIKELFNTAFFLKNIKNISLTGGEPFLRTDFVHLLGFFLARYPRTTIFITTNSLNPKLLINRMEEIFKRFLPNPQRIRIGFSLDGIGETHDKVRGKSNSYDRVLKGMEMIRKQYPGINISVNFTITPYNFKNLIEVYNLSNRIGARFGTQFAQMSDIYYRNMDIKYFMTMEQLHTIQKQMGIICREREKTLGFIKKIVDVEGIYLSNLLDFQKEPRRLFRCFSGIHSFFLDPYGNVFPCIMLPHKLGNIRHDKFDEMWFSKKAFLIREDIKSEKCYCWTGCEAIPSLLRDYRIPIKNLLNSMKNIF